MITIKELVYHKYKTQAGMKEMKGIIAVSEMIATLGRTRTRLFSLFKSERNKRVMS